MNISPINFNFVQKAQKSPIRYAYNNLKCDSVSFSGKKKPQNEELSKNALEGISLGKKVLKYSRNQDFSFDNISDMVNTISPVEVRIDDMRNCPAGRMNAYGAIIAHMFPLYNYDFKLDSANIYLGLLPSTSKERADFAANLAHEYTHVLQRAQDNEYYGILKYTKDIQEVPYIARAAQGAMSEILNYCKSCLFTTQTQADKAVRATMEGRYSVKDQKIDETVFDEIISKAAKKVSQNLNKDYFDMKNAIKGWIKKEAQNEVEAYSVTIGVLDSAKSDPITRAKRLLNKEIHELLADM